MRCNVLIACQISTSVLFALAILAIAVRCVILFWIQKLSFSLDDGFLFFGFECLLVSLAVLYLEVLDRMYFITALQNGVEGVVPPPDWMQISFHFHKWVTVCNMSA